MYACAAACVYVKQPVVLVPMTIPVPNGRPTGNAPVYAVLPLAIAMHRAGVTAPPPAVGFVVELKIMIHHAAPESVLSALTVNE